MDNYTFFKKTKKNKQDSFPSFNMEEQFDLSYGMVFINSEDKMNDFIDK